MEGRIYCAVALASPQHPDSHPRRLQRSHKRTGDVAVTLGDRRRAITPDCIIKGNVNRNGERIYHMPSQRFYARVRMDVGGGKRWFTPEEAEAPGWRRAFE